MKRFVLAALLGCASSLVCLSADDAAANGAKFLQKVGAAWAQKLPSDQVLGMYVGRVWVGKGVLSVKAAPADSGAAFELTSDVEFALLGSKMHEHSRSLLAKDLTVVGAEAESENPEGKLSLKLTAKDGHWKLHMDKAGQSKDSEGDVKPNTTWDAGAFLLYAVPEGTMEMVNLKSDKGTNVSAFTKLGEKQKLMLGGKAGEYACVQESQGEENTFTYYGDDGKVCAVKFGGAPFIIRPVEDGKVGKNLDEPLPVTAAGRAVLDMYVAMQKNDKDALAAVFDFDTMASEAKTDAEQLKTGIVTELTSEEQRKNLPDASVMEDLMASMMNCEEKGDEAVVTMGTSKFKLHKSADPAKKGAWLIYGMGQ